MNTINISEEKFNKILSESINRVLFENGMEEGFLGNVFSGMRNMGSEAGKRIGNRAQATANAMKQKANYIGNGVAQGVNKMKSDYYAGAASNAEKDVQAQIAKSQEIINREQQKINNLRAKQNSLVNKSNAYTDKANTNAANRGSETRYNNTNVQTDNTTCDFYNNKDLLNHKKGAMLTGARRAHNKMNSTPAPRRTALEESVIDKMVTDIINELKH